MMLSKDLFSDLEATYNVVTIEFFRYYSDYHT